MMSAWVLALTVAAADTSARARVPAPAPEASRAADPWIAPDKVKHATVAFALQGGAYAVMRGATDHRLALAGATIVTTALSLLKERMDRSTSGFSVRDLVWDAAGVAAASVILAAVPHR